MSLKDFISDWLTHRNPNDFFMPFGSTEGFSSKEKVQTWEISNTTRLIRKFRGFANTILILMEIKKPKITLSDSLPTACNINGTHIVVGTKVFGESFDNFKKLDISLGFLFHEGLHTEYTDMKIGYDSKLEMFIANTLEDERIETFGLAKYPQYAEFLRRAKEYVFEKEQNTELSAGLAEKMAFFFEFVRFPKNLNEDIFNKHEETFVEMKNILTPYPETNEAVKTATTKIYELVKEEHQNLESDAKEKLEELLDRLMRIIKGAYSDEDSDDSDRQIIDEILENGQQDEEKLITDVSFVKAKGNKSLYQSLKSSVSSKASTLSVYFKQKAFEKLYVSKNQKSGRFDTTKIVEAGMGLENVYERKYIDVIDKLTVCIVLDLSGSMGYDDKIESAKLSAVLLVEALKRVKNIDVFVYGHTADCNEDGKTTSLGKTVVYVYKEPGVSVPHALASAKPLSCNRDGVALLAIGKRVRKFTKEKCLMLVVSDGMPYAHEYYYTGEEHTAEAVKELTKKGFIPIQVAIDATNPEKMFKDFVKFTDLNALPKDMGKLLKKKMKDLQVPRRVEI